MKNFCTFLEQLVPSLQQTGWRCEGKLIMNGSSWTEWIFARTVHLAIIKMTAICLQKTQF